MKFHMTVNLCASVDDEDEQQQIVRQYCIERGKKGAAPERKAAHTTKKRS